MIKMKVVFVFFVLWPNVAHACSTFASSNTGFSDVRNHSDLVFEGEVTAVYIGGKQVSTSLFDEAISKLWKTTEILFKITPTKVLVGHHGGQFQVWGAYVAYGYCGRGLNAHVRQKVWGANLVDGKLTVAPYRQYIKAVVAMETYREALARYQSSLPERHFVQDIILREHKALRQILGGELASPASAFFSTPKERALMPSQLYQARMEFLEIDYALERERLTMTTEILFPQ